MEKTWQQRVDTFISPKIQELLLSGDKESFLLGWELCQHKPFLSVWIQWHWTVGVSLGLHPLMASTNNGGFWYTVSSLTGGIGPYSTLTLGLNSDSGGGCGYRALKWAKDYIIEHEQLIQTNS